jgi:hypothetical protein
MAESLSLDRELYRQLAKGREEAFSALYERYQGPIFRFAWHMSGNSATAEDVTQEVFMLLIRNPRNYDRQRAPWQDIFSESRGILRGASWTAAASTNHLPRIGPKATKLSWSVTQIF